MLPVMCPNSSTLDKDSSHRRAFNFIIIEFYRELKLILMEINMMENERMIKNMEKY